MYLMGFLLFEFFIVWLVAAMSEDPIREWILTQGKATQITKIGSVGGGCINLASHYHTDAGSFFVKTNRCIKMCLGFSTFMGLLSLDHSQSDF